MIISASRRTDIPALYFEWFLNRVKAGYFDVKNPMNPKQVSRVIVTPENTDCIVFWTKNPIPSLKKLNELKKFLYYFQYTLNPYPNTIEKNLPSIESRINAFKELSNIIGKERVIWRYDPIFFTDKINVDFHIENFNKLVRELRGYTSEVNISILDDYRKIRNNMRNLNIKSMDYNAQEVLFTTFKKIADDYGLIIRSCSEKVDLIKFGIIPGKCIDDELISKLLGQKITIKKDKNQRDTCGCVESVEIGAYNTCTHGCRYCYANYCDETVKNNIRNHNISSSMIIGVTSDTDKINLRKIKVYKDKGLSATTLDQLTFIDM